MVVLNLGSQLAGAGGVIRGGHENWLADFFANLGKAMSVLAEIWGLFHGLKLVVGMGFNNVLIEMDSAVVVKWIKEGVMADHPYAGIVENCRDMLCQHPFFSVSHVVRECNCVADGLANLSLGVRVLDGVHTDVGQLVAVDAMGKVLPREVLL